MSRVASYKRPSELTIGKTQPSLMKFYLKTIYSFNDMILQKFINQYGSEFISIQAVKPSEKSKFICSTCGLKLTSNSALERHQMVHSDDRFWRCPICHEEFKHYHGAQNHGKTQHGMVIKPGIFAKNTNIIEIEGDVPVDTSVLDYEIKTTNGKVRKVYPMEYKRKAVQYYVDNGKKMFWEKYTGHVSFKTAALWRKAGLKRAKKESDDDDPDFQPVEKMNKIEIPTEVDLKTDHRDEEDDEEDVPALEFTPNPARNIHALALEESKSSTAKNLSFGDLSDDQILYAKEHYSTSRNMK